MHDFVKSPDEKGLSVIPDTELNKWDAKFGWHRAPLKWIEKCNIWNRFLELDTSSQIGGETFKKIFIRKVQFSFKEMWKEKKREKRKKKKGKVNRREGICLSMSELKIKWCFGWSNKYYHLFTLHYSWIKEKPFSSGNNRARRRVNITMKWNQRKRQ